MPRAVDGHPLEPRLAAQRLVVDQFEPGLAARRRTLELGVRGDILRGDDADMAQRVRSQRPPRVLAHGHPFDRDGREPRRIGHDLPAASMPTSRATTGSAPGPRSSSWAASGRPASRSSAAGRRGRRPRTPSRPARRSSTAAPSSSSRRSSRRSTDTSRLIRLAARGRPCWSRTMPRAAGITSSRTRLSSAAARASSASTTWRLNARAASVPTSDITRTARMSRRAWTRSVMTRPPPRPSRRPRATRGGPGSAEPAGGTGHEQQREGGEDQRPGRARDAPHRGPRRQPTDPANHSTAARASTTAPAPMASRSMAAKGPGW